MLGASWLAWVLRWFVWVRLVDSGEGYGGLARFHSCRQLPSQVVTCWILVGSVSVMGGCYVGGSVLRRSCLGRLGRRARLFLWLPPSPWVVLFVCLWLVPLWWFLAVGCLWACWVFGSLPVFPLLVCLRFTDSTPLHGWCVFSATTCGIHARACTAVLFCFVFWQR